MRLPLLFALFLSSIAVCALRAEEGAGTERAKAAFLLCHGRLPNAQELSHVAGLGVKDTRALLAEMERSIASTSELKKAVHAAATLDALGVSAGSSHEAAGTGEGVAYFRMVARLISEAALSAADYEAVIHRAYRRALARDAYPGELKYWARQPRFSYAMLVACIDNWARRNAPGLMETEGAPTVSLNSEYLQCVRVTPELADELRRATGVSSLDAAHAAATGKLVVAPGAAGVTSAGPVPIVAVGRR
jgi:hypothetical protein